MGRQRFVNGVLRAEASVPDPLEDITAGAPPRFVQRRQVRLIGGQQSIPAMTVCNDMDSRLWILVQEAQDPLGQRTARGPS